MTYKVSSGPLSLYSLLMCKRRPTLLSGDFCSVSVYDPLSTRDLRCAGYFRTEFWLSVPPTIYRLERLVLETLHYVSSLAQNTNLSAQLILGCAVWLSPLNMDRRIFIYADSLLASFSAEMSDPYKQPESRWRRLPASWLPRLLNSHGPIADRLTTVTNFRIAESEWEMYVQNLKRIVVDGACESYVGGHIETGTELSANKAPVFVADICNVCCCRTRWRLL